MVSDDGAADVAHVPSAFGRQGSTLMTVAQRVSDVVAANGGRSAAILSHNRDLTMSGPVEIHYVDYTRVCPREWYSRRELATDVVLGFAGRERRFHSRLYDPAIEELAANPARTVLLYEGHYASASLPRWGAVRDSSELVLYVHNPLSRTYGRRELTRLLDHADRVVFCADHLRRDVERRTGRSDPRFSTVHNGIDRIFLVGADRTPPDGPFEVVYAGRITEKKGVHLVLEAVDRASALTGRAFRVRVIGSADYTAGDALTEYERSLRDRAEAMSSPVEFVPFVRQSELVSYLRSASAACLPSQWAEGLPLAALEAMAAGLPVVCSDSPGLVEASGDAACVVRGGEPEGMASALARLADDDEEWLRRSRRSWQRAQHFSWERATASLLGR